MQTIAEMEEYLKEEKRKGATVIKPSSLTPISYYRPVIETVFLSGNDYYKAQGKFRISYAGLTKLGNAAGIEWDPLYTCRVDNRNDKMYVSFRAVGGLRKNDGKLYPVKAEYDLDLEIIEQEIKESYLNKKNDKYNKGKSDEEFAQYMNFCVNRDLIQKKKRKLTLAESGAKARVLRSVLDIPSQYSNENQINGMPFIVVRFVLDHQNPDIKKLFLETARQSMLGLYGSSTTQALPAVSQNSLDDIIDIPTAEPDSEPDPMNSSDVDFQNLDSDGQIDTLQELCEKKGYNLQRYLDQTKSSLDGMSPEKRLEFFQHLNSLSKR